MERFDREDMDYHLKWASDRRESHSRDNDRAVDKSRGGLDLDLLGVKGEHGVWRKTGGLWYPSRAKDPGWDILRGDGLKIEVKTTHYEDGHFAVPVWQEKIKWDVGVLVVYYAEDSVDIRTWIRAEKFKELSALKNFGFGKTAIAVAQEDMEPWKRSTRQHHHDLVKS